jgi:hypothetical protein
MNFASRLMIMIQMENTTYNDVSTRKEDGKKEKKNKVNYMSLQDTKQMLSYYHLRLRLMSCMTNI